MDWEKIPGNGEACGCHESGGRLANGHAESYVGVPADPAISYQTKWMVDLERTTERTPGLEKLADRPLETLVVNGVDALCQEAPEPVGEGVCVPARRAPCRACRLAILIGTDDDAIKGALDWVLLRARALGGCFYTWEIKSDSSPFIRINVRDISGGQSPRPRDYQKFGTRRFDAMHPDLAAGRGRIDELLVIHHGEERDSAEQIRFKKELFVQVAINLQDILARQLKIPVCRLIYWSCYAASQIDVAQGGVMDALMSSLGSLDLAQRTDCGCPGPVELIYPTAGICSISAPGAPVVIQTGDGRVNRVRWGYRHRDGRLRKDPDPEDRQPLRRPNATEASVVGGEQVLGVPVSTRSA